MKYNIFLSGEIHSDWRNDIIKGAESADLPVSFSYPEQDHDQSDHCGTNILGKEDKKFWADNKSARINSIRIRKSIKSADIIIVKFGEKYRQWNAAFDAGFAAALGKSLITVHPEEFDHALKEIDAAARATARTHEQVVEVLKYICRE